MNDRERFGGVDDADIPVGLEHPQVLVAGDDKIGACGKRAGDDCLVIGVAPDAAAKTAVRYELDELLILGDER